MSETVEREGKNLKKKKDDGNKPLQGDQIGKIAAVKYGYMQDKFGLHIHFTSNGNWQTIWGQLLEDDNYETHVKAIKELLNSLNIQSVEQLNGLPVMCNFDKGILSSWRILFEAI